MGKAFEHVAKSNVQFEEGDRRASEQSLGDAKSLFEEALNVNEHAATVLVVEAANRADEL